MGNTQQPKKFNRKILIFIFSILVLNAVLVSRVVAQPARSPSSINLFTIISPQENAFLKNDTSYSHSEMGGIIGDTISAAETVLGGDSFSNQYAQSKSTSDSISSILKQYPDIDYNTAIYLINNSTAGGGVMGMISSGTNLLVTQRPASGTWFLEQKVYALTNPGKVYAQSSTPSPYYPGLGFDLLKPIYGFWGWSVNIVFGFLILLIIVIAFAIMFQQRLGAKTAITLQTAIPSIALALILVPFSYAISGAFIDLITLGTNVVHGFVLGPGSPGKGVYDDIVSESISQTDCAKNGVFGDDCNRGLYADDWRVGVLRFREQIDLRPTFSEVGDTLQLKVFDFIVPILNAIFWEEAATGQTVPSTAAWFGAIVNMGLSILMIWYGIKAFIILFGKYLTLIILPIASPFIFATVAVPGTGIKNVTMYAKRLGAAALSYIVTYGILLLTIVLTHQAFLSTLPELRSGAFVPPLLGITAAIGGGSTTLAKLLFTLIGLGMYFSLPKILASVDKALGVSGPLIPDFIKTPWEGLKESWNVTRGVAGRAVRAPFAVPGLAQKGLEVLESTRDGLNLNAMRNRWIARRQDRAGIGQENETSARYQHKKDLEGKWAEAKRQFDAAVASGDRRGALRYKGDMDDLDKEATRNSITLSHSTKPEDKVSISAVFKSKSNDPDNMIIFKTDRLDDIFLKVTGRKNMTDAAGSYPVATALIAADLVLEAKKLAFPPEPVIQIGYASLVPGSSQDLEWGGPAPANEQFSAAIASPPAVALTFGAAKTGFENFIRIRANNGFPAMTPADVAKLKKALSPDYYEGKKITIPMAVEIGFGTPLASLNEVSFGELFGTRDTSTGRYVGGFLASYGASFKFGDVGTDSNKRIFRINGKDSNAITVNIIKQD